MPDFAKALVLLALGKASADIVSLFDGHWIGWAAGLCILAAAILLGIAWCYDWARERNELYAELKRLRERQPWR